VCRIGSLVSDRGAPWLLGTESIRKVRGEFLRQSHAYVNRMHERFPRLENFVHSANRLSIRWLKWCGFTVETQTLTLNGEEFFKFWRESHV
jgi:hypothetical protein